MLIGVIVGYALAAALGLLDPQALAAVGDARRGSACRRSRRRAGARTRILVIAPVFVVLVAENKGHIAAISSYMERDLNPLPGPRLPGRRPRHLRLGAWAAARRRPPTPRTWASWRSPASSRRATSSWPASIAILLGLCPKFGALIRSIPNPVLGGVTLILYGLIALMGVKIWMDAKVDFADHRNMVVAGASLIVATGLGVKGVTVGGTNIAGIAFGTVLALVVHLLLRTAPGGREETSG